MSLKECSDAFPEIGQNVKKYRYFNQPIEQIPGFLATESQILFHGQDGGLYWQTIPSGCVEVTTCVKIETDSPGSEDYKIKAEKTRIRPLQNLGDLDDPVECGDFPTEAIDVVTCIKLEGESLVIERTKALIIKNMGTPGTICENIPLTVCPSGSGI